MNLYIRSWSKLEMTKKILIDARMYGLENSGIGRYLVNLIGELKKIQIDSYFLILLRKKYFDKLKFPENCLKILADFGHYGFNEQIKLPGILSELKPDLVHFPHLNVPIFWSGKFIVTIHDLTMHHQKTDATTLPLLLYYIKRLPYLLASSVAVRKSLKIITPTNFVASEITDYYNVNRSKIEVINEGYTPTLKTDERDESETLAKYNIKKPYFFYVGNAYPHKNLKRAIEATAQLNKNGNLKVSLILGGSRNVFTKRLDELIFDLDAGDFIGQIGFVNDEDLTVINKHSVGFLYPSLAEGFGLQGLEAMSAGTLVLCSNMPVFKEIYGDYAFYFNPLDFSSITSAMQYALTLDSEKRARFISASQKFIKKYSWQKMAKETLKVYENCIGV